MKKGLPLNTEFDLEKRKEKDNYYIQKIAKYTVLAAVVTLVIYLVGAFIFRCSTDKIFQNAIFDIIKQNLVAIVFFAMSLLGISQVANKK